VSSKRIAVLFHREDRHYDSSRYMVEHLARCWRADGHEVVYLFGTRRFVPADLVLVHVNLSVVPESYLEFAARYPIALNRHVRDIRKSTISRHLVRPGDGWDGPVVVKSNLNYAGEPERRMRRNWLERRWPLALRARRRIDRARGNSPVFWESADYAVFDSLEEVPAAWLAHPQVVVEKFRPEVEDGLYHCRVFQFLGDRCTCTRLASPHPIVKMDRTVGAESVEPDSGILEWRERLRMDYGKLDYGVVDGEVVLFDANKTTGAALPQGDSTHMSRQRLESQRRHRAEGLYAYFGG
jgi:hypothetical protein